MTASCSDQRFTVQAAYFVQDARNAYSLAANFSSFNTVAQVLLQPDKDQGFDYVWQRTSEASGFNSSGNMSTLRPFVVKGRRAPCCVHINPRLQATAQESCKKPDGTSPGWKHYGANLSGQLMASCQLEELPGNKIPFRVKSAFFDWFGDKYELNQTELASADSPFVLMINGSNTTTAIARGGTLQLHDW